MPVYRITPTAIEPLQATTFQAQGLKERDDLQRLLRSNISVLGDDLLVIDEEFRDWQDSRRRVDLLCIDRAANLVVVELKRDDDGGHMELQAIRYAAMVSTMTFAHAAARLQSHLDRTGAGGSGEARLLEFLGWEEPNEDDFGRDVRIILVAADFSKEITTAVLWLNERAIDIRCVRIKPYINENQTIVDVQQVVPLPEAEEYMIRMREKAAVVRVSLREEGTKTGFWFMNCGDGSNDGRAWEDCVTYNFISAGGGRRWIDAAQRLQPGDRLFAYLSGHGYVGCGVVTAPGVPFNDFVPTAHSTRLRDLPLHALIQSDRMSNPEEWDLCVAVRWIKTFPRKAAILKSRARNGTLHAIRQQPLVDELLAGFGLSAEQVHVAD